MFVRMCLSTNSVRVVSSAQSTELVWILDFKQILLLLLFPYFEVTGIQLRYFYLVPDSKMCGRHSQRICPRSSAHSRDRHRAGSFTTTYSPSTYDMTIDCKNTDEHLLQEDRLTQFTESTFAQTTIPTNIHNANIVFTNIILIADKHNMTKGKMHSNCRLLPEDIVCKIIERNSMRRANTCDPALKTLK